MKTLHKIKLIAGILAIAVMAVSCVEGIAYEDLGEGGATIVKLVPASPGGFFKSVVEPTDQPQTFTLLDIRREATPVDLDTRTVVSLTFNTGVLDAYNTANGTTFIPVPQANYTTVPANSSGNIDIVFEPGDFVKEMSMTIPNAFDLDPGLQYAMGYVMTVSSGKGVLSATSSDSIVIQMLPKNLYDADYDYHLLYYHPNAGEWPDNLNWEGTGTRTLGTVNGNTIGSNEFALWGGVASTITFNEDVDETVTYWVSYDDWGLQVDDGNPNVPEEYSYYDRPNETIHLIYNYLGGSGYRIFYEDLVRVR